MQSCLSKPVIKGLYNSLFKNLNIKIRKMKNKSLKFKISENLKNCQKIIWKKARIWNLKYNVTKDKLINWKLLWLNMTGTLETTILLTTNLSSNNLKLKILIWEKCWIFLKICSLWTVKSKKDRKFKKRRMFLSLLMKN